MVSSWCVGAEAPGEWLGRLVDTHKLDVIIEPASLQDGLGSVSSRHDTATLVDTSAKVVLSPCKRVAAASVDYVVFLFVHGVSNGGRSPRLVVTGWKNQKQGN